MRVRELIEALHTMPQELPVALCVYNHIYGVMQQASHGPLEFALGNSNGVPASLFIGPMLDYEIETKRIEGKVVFAGPRRSWQDYVRDITNPWEKYSESE